MPPTSIVPTATIFDLDGFLKLCDSVEEVTAGMASVGDAAAYALVWEWGNIRQTQPGPKTVVGINPDGTSVWLSSQAPLGYIRVNEPKYWNIIKNVLQKLDFNQPNGKALRRDLEFCARTIAQKMVEVTQETVPVDKGDLHDSLRAVNPGSKLLTMEGDEYETFSMEE